MAHLDEIPVRFKSRKELEHTATAVFSEYSRILGFKNLRCNLSEKLKPDTVAVGGEEVRPFCTATHEGCEVIMEIGFMHDTDPRLVKRWDILLQYLATHVRGFMILVAPRDMINMVRQHGNRLHCAPNVMLIAADPSELKDAVYNVYYKMILNPEACD